MLYQYLTVFTSQQKRQHTKAPTRCYTEHVANVKDILRVAREETFSPPRILFSLSTFFTPLSKAAKSSSGATACQQDYTRCGGAHSSEFVCLQHKNSRQGMETGLHAAVACHVPAKNTRASQRNRFSTYIEGCAGGNFLPRMILMPQHQSCRDRCVKKDHSRQQQPEVTLL